MPFVVSMLTVCLWFGMGKYVSVFAYVMSVLYI